MLGKASTACKFILILYVDNFTINVDLFCRGFVYAEERWIKHRLVDNGGTYQELTEELGMGKKIHARKFKDVISYPPSMNNSNWRRRGLQFVISLGKWYKHLE